jgi:hypothetical protein
MFVPNHQTTGGQDVGETKSVMHYAIYLQQLRNMGVPEREWPARWTLDPCDYLKPIVFDVQNPDKTTHQRRRAQLRHFDQFPYAEEIAPALAPAAAAFHEAGDEAVGLLDECC